jgi:hypothetical protein
MPRGPSARELRWIREKYSRMSDHELLVVQGKNITPEAREILAGEIAKRQIDPLRSDRTPDEMERYERDCILAEQYALSPPLGNSTLWGILVMLDVFVATGIDSWTAKFIAAIVGGVFIAQGKKCRSYDQKVKQLERDAAAKEIRDRLGVSVSQDDK